MRRLICALTAALGALVAAPPASAEDITVRTQHLRCVVDNIRVYRAVSKDPVLVIFERCPNPELNPAALAALATTSRVSGGGSDSGPTPALSLRKAELACLAKPNIAERLFASASGGVIKWPRNVCKL